ncbi:Hint domain-containing protein [Antarctobacter heliothermus]|uniref:Hint domain-containing protein n=1 Tax=Antarctobacter heliothermus TaxID=74033 RepID=A0A239AWT9_9RHOB|nr:Hint domain-containing protein [Antarctobacter heliothermus]SNR99792.1 Hint domain-containing protein [Antarctobacter heliothermus]
MPTTHIVNVLHDTSVVDGDLTLREAVAQAGSGDTIVFSVTGTVELSQGEITIGTDLTINGDVTGADNVPDITIDGNDARIFSVGSGGTLNLDALILTGANSAVRGGAVDVANGGTLIANHANFISNTGASGGAISNSGTVTITDSSLSDNFGFNIGGGLFNDATGTANIIDSVISENNAALGSGGGIHNSGMLTVTGTAISDNISGGSGKLFDPGGGGLANVDFGTAEITSSVFSGNNDEEGYGGAIANIATLTLTDVLITDNGTSPFWRSIQGGGIMNYDGHLTLINTTISANRAGEGSGLFDEGPNTTLIDTTITGDTYYLDANSTTITNSIILGTYGSGITQAGPAPVITNSVTSGDAATVFAAMDPLTGGGVLADNGGLVQTIALKDDPSNPALDIGTSALPDARGEALFDVPGAGNDGSNFADAGAYELQCFGPGTLIATPKGETAVEALRIGDAVLTADGRAVPVLWVGRQTVVTRLASPRQEPVRIRAGALGPGLPHSDLVVTADHGMLVDGLLINAGALVNGATIRFVPLSEMDDRVTYCHIETEVHEAILANGTPSESFVDYAGRHGFDNHADYIARYGADRLIAEMALLRISSRRMLPETVRARLGIGDSTPRPMSA